MKRPCLLSRKISTFILTLAASPALAQETFTFGTDNEGLAGFTTNTISTHESWSTEDGSIRYLNDDIGEINDDQDGPTRDAALLREFVLDRTPGNSYRMEGTVTLSDGYADDNNRVGIYLFSKQADLTGELGPSPSDEEPGALFLHYNSDIGRNQVLIDEGLDGPNQALEVKDAGNLGEDLFETDLTFEALIEFIESNGSNFIDVTFTMTDSTGDATTIMTTVPADSYTGSYFGFATRARCRGVSLLDRVEPWTMDYRSFSFIDLSGPPKPDLTLSITGPPTSGAFEISWPSQAGKVYDIVSSTDLTTAVSTWPIWDNRTGITASANGVNTISNLLSGGASNRFFAVIERDQ